MGKPLLFNLFEMNVPEFNAELLPKVNDLLLYTQEAGETDTFVSAIFPSRKNYD